MTQLEPQTRRKSQFVLRSIGVTWIVLSPVIFLMAAISTVESNLTYQIQLVAFSTVALAGMIAGIGALFRHVWAAKSLMILSWIGAVYYLGSATLLLLWPFIPGTGAKFDFLLIPIVLGVAVFGIPFLLMAIRLKILLR